ncbi:hypothetical protein [Streptomyces monashensis]|uniref:Uncharacterized protein n=1 Tax=Streptomyces monashensis TaxID=1678012 RepID=A0A1S2QJV7_9ACTN|nr:hypothetical protein [Streptomyces monashensis]OIK06422.1 hypothetical protein BIV23_08580 [Streptomyces monashensis]
MKRRPQRSGPHPIPRDLPDQQAGHGDDRWEPHTADRRTQERKGAGEREDTGDVPDVDEAGAGPRGAPRRTGVHPDHPVPEEPSG